MGGFQVHSGMPTPATAYRRLLGVLLLAVLLIVMMVVVSSDSADAKGSSNSNATKKAVKSSSSNPSLSKSMTNKFQLRMKRHNEGKRIKAIKELRFKNFVKEHRAYLEELLKGNKRVSPFHHLKSKPSMANAEPSTDGGGTKVVEDGQIDYYDVLYTSNITIGSNEQPFVVVLDTGSANLWVPDVDCGTGDSHLSTEQCENKHRFNSSESDTYVEDGTEFEISYGKGFVEGFQGMDTVRLGAADGPQLVIPNTTFGQATDFSNAFAKSPFDGILGLAFQSISANNVTPPFINALEQGLVAEPMFTVYLDTSKGKEVDAPSGGVFTFGGMDTTNCGELIDWVKLSSAKHWEFKLDKVKVGNKTILSKASTAFSDTGTSLIMADTKVARAIANKLKLKKSLLYGVYVVKCDADYDPVTFIINGKEYNVTSKVLTMPAGLANNWCLFGIQPIDLSNLNIDWVLGDPFIRQFCNTYDVGNERIGLSPTLGLADDDE